MKKELINKFIYLEKQIADEKGDFVLFGLFRREESLIWDVVASSHWIGEDTDKQLRYIANKMQSELTPDDMLMVSRIVLLEPSNEFVKAVNEEFDTVNKVVKCGREEFNGIFFEKGYIITSRQISSQVG